MIDHRLISWPEGLEAISGGDITSPADRGLPEQVSKLRRIEWTIERDSIPAGRPGDAREIASLVCWLASEGAAYATGHSFVVDGGLLLMAAVRNE